jgi:hypothetical protein
MRFQVFLKHHWIYFHVTLIFHQEEEEQKSLLSILLSILFSLSLSSSCQYIVGARVKGYKT